MSLYPGSIHFSVRDLIYVTKLMPKAEQQSGVPAEITYKEQNTTDLHLNAPQIDVMKFMSDAVVFCSPSVRGIVQKIATQNQMSQCHRPYRTLHY